MAPTNATDESESADQHPALNIETVIVDPDDILEAFRRNHRDQDRQERHVLRIHPPFDTTVEAKLRVDQTGAYYPHDRDPRPFVISPGQFVEHTKFGPRASAYTDIAHPTRDQAYRQAEHEINDPSDEIVDKFYEALVEVWEEEVRRHLLDEILVVHTEDGEVHGNVRYESGGEQ